MHKSVILFFSIVLYLQYGLSVLFNFLLIAIAGVLDNPITVIPAIWAILSNILMLFGLYKIIKADVFGKNLLLSVVGICVLLQIADALVIAHESDFSDFSIADILKLVAFPLFSFWVLNYSDSNEYFQSKISKEHEEA